jgi:uncharacterized protein YqjF (DUF2071 family)
LKFFRRPAPAPIQAQRARSDVPSHPALTQTDHRPWPLPAQPWSWRQSWCDLLFAHWPVPADALTPLISPGLQIDEFDGSAWVGVVPFRMQGVMRRPLPDLPWISAFPELNVRTYVTYRGKPGVWFLSLDATNPLAVWAAKRWFHLPYHRAKMSVRQTGERTEYTSQRIGSEAELNGWFCPTGEIYESKPGSLEHWLTERYCLFAASKSGRLSCTEVHHAPWPLQPAEAEFEKNSLLLANGIDCPGPPELLHFAKRLDVVVWSPEEL